jgi:quinol monooxygenase YgiN
MTFLPDKRQDFLTMFENVSPKIRAFQGCYGLALWEDVKESHILTTYSLWEDEEALEQYRKSELFKETWAMTKQWFGAAPQAFSQHSIRNLG